MEGYMFLRRAIVGIMVWCGCFVNLPMGVVFAETASPIAWLRQFGTVGSDAGWGLAVDGDNSVFIGGTTGGNLGGPNIGVEDAFLAKFDASGMQLWSRQFGTVALDDLRSVTVDGGGSVYIVGTTAGAFGGANVGSYDAFLAKYDSLGTFLWSRQIGTEDYDLGRGVAVDGIGSVYISGTTAGSLGRSNFGNTDAFLAKYDSMGTFLWSRQIGTANDDVGDDVAVDRDGNVFLAQSTTVGRGGPFPGTKGSFLNKFDETGTLLWSREIGIARNNPIVRSLTVDGIGNAYVSGMASGDAFVSKYDAAGAQIWSRALRTNGSDVSDDVAVDSAGNVWICGVTSGSLAEANAGNYDAFVAKYDAAGNHLWSRQFGTAESDGAAALGVDAVGNIYVTGNTWSSLGRPSAGSADVIFLKFAVPEPSAGVLIVWGVIGLMARRRYN